MSFGYWSRLDLYLTQPRAADVANIASKATPFIIRVLFVLITFRSTVVVPEIAGSLVAEM
ncbi:hypothetical protein D3C80_2125520 [compost metagenome]